VEAMNAALRRANGDSSDLEDSEGDEDDAGEEEWKGFDESIIVNHEDEYIDEDKYTTVTVEAVDITRDGFINTDTANVPDDGAATEKIAGGGEAPTESGKSGTAKRTWTKERPQSDRPKKKKKKFRYETKAERKLTRAKERAKNKAKAKARRGE
jgi:ribosomal RNA-processing protein 17